MAPPDYGEPIRPYQMPVEFTERLPALVARAFEVLGIALPRYHLKELRWERGGNRRIYPLFTFTSLFGHETVSNLWQPVYVNRSRL